jgi:hypothetical protein
MYKKEPVKNGRSGKDRTKPKGSHGIKSRDVKEQLRLRGERLSGRIFRKTIGLEIAKRIARSSARMRKMRDWTLWRDRSPLKRKMKSLADCAPETSDHRPI